jgi:TolA-binding protein
VVHGTAFVVEVTRANDGQTHTCVRVTEGTVSVRHADGERWVSAQGSWGCDDSPTSTASERTASAGPPAETEPLVSPNSPRVAAGPSERSTLGVEARLLQTALGAERRGDFELAEKTLSSLLNTYPNSVVAPDARTALARVRHRQQERMR